VSTRRESRVWLIGSGVALHKRRWHALRRLVPACALATTLVLSVVGTTGPEAGAKVARNAVDAKLEQWKARGAAGFVCTTNYLNGLGGTQAFTGDLGSDLTLPGYTLERTLADSDFAVRAKALGLVAYLGFYLVNYHNTQTPLAEWFDDTAWSETVLPDVRLLAAGARVLGFEGVAFDQELYPQSGDVSTASWNWGYPGNVHTQQAVRREVRARGQQIMTALLRGFPGLSIVAYDTLFPGTWDATVQQAAKGVTDPYGQSVQLDFWDGLTSVDGYGHVLFLDATFYKQPGVSGASWDAALQYQQNSFFSVLSQHLSNWSYAWSRVYESPFAWIDGDVAHEGSYAAPRSVPYVAKQLGAFEHWTMDGTYGIYAYGPLETFDYRPYVPTLRETAQASSVRPPTPELFVVASSGGGTHAPGARRMIVIHGYATDRYAIRAVYWRDGHRQVAAAMSWQRGDGNDALGWDWKMSWTVRVTATSGAHRFALVAVSTSGLTTTRTVVIPQ
jgi:hypothetical protein